MLDVVRRGFDRITQAFELFERGGNSAFSLAIVVRGQAEGLRAFRADVADPLLAFADEIEAVGKDPRPALKMPALAKRFEVWKKDTLAVIDAERPTATKKEVAAKTEEQRAASREALLAEARSYALGSEAPPTGTAKERAAQSEEQKRLAREALLAEARAFGDASEAPAPVALAKEAAKPAAKAPPAEDDPDAMSMDEIQRLLDGAKK